MGPSFLDNWGYLYYPLSSNFFIKKNCTAEHRKKADLKIQQLKNEYSENQREKRKRKNNILCSFPSRFSRNA